MIKKTLTILVLIFIVISCGKKVETLDGDISKRLRTIIAIKNLNDEVKKTKDFDLNYENGVITVKDLKDNKRIINGKYYLFLRDLLEINVKNNKLDKEILVYSHIPHTENDYKLISIFKVNNGEISDQNYSVFEDRYIELEKLFEKRRVYRNMISQTNFNYFFGKEAEEFTQKIFSVDDGNYKIFEIKIDPKSGQEKELIKFDEEGNKIMKIKYIDKVNRIKVSDFKNNKETNIRMMEL